MSDFSYQKMCEHVNKNVGKAIESGVKLALGTAAGTFMNPLKDG